MNKKGNVSWWIVAIIIALIFLVVILLFNTTLSAKTKDMINGVLGNTETPIDRTQINDQSKQVLANLKTTYTECVHSSKSDCLCRGSGNILDGMYKKYALSFEQGKINLIDAEHDNMNIAHEDMSMNCYLIYKDTGDKYLATTESKNFMLNLEETTLYKNRPLLYKTADNKVCWIIPDKLRDLDFNDNQGSVLKPWGWKDANEKYVNDYLNSVALCN